MITACWALRLYFSSSSIAAFRRISVCFWLAMTFAACSLSRRCCSWASVIACSSWIFGSAFSLKTLESLAPMYFHHFFSDVNMPASLRHAPWNLRGLAPTESVAGRPVDAIIGSNPCGRARIVHTTNTGSADHHGEQDLGDGARHLDVGAGDNDPHQDGGGDQHARPSSQWSSTPPAPGPDGSAPGPQRPRPPSRRRIRHRQPGRVEQDDQGDHQHTLSMFSNRFR